jgi:hypothetical protein
MRMKAKIIVALVLNMLMSVAFCQNSISILPTYLYVDGVSNDGRVYGGKIVFSSFYIWDPDADQITAIGGISGNARARCSADGNYVSGSAYEQVPTVTRLQQVESLVNDQLASSLYHRYSLRNARFAGRPVLPDLSGALYQINANYQDPQMARYNVSTGEWNTLGSVDDDVHGAGTTISGDGNTVAGIEIGYDYQHSVVWNESEGLVLLDAGATAAAGMSHDSSIIAGMQMVANEYFKCAVWRKNPAGGYFPFETLLVDPSGDPNDPNNILGDAWAVSGNGEWIGGFGDEATNNQPWIWSEATGCILLGDLGLGDGYIGTVAAFDHQGTTVVGYFSNFGWRPWPVTPFIWTQENGMQDLNVYATQTLGLNLGSATLKWAEAISPNGRYIAGRIAEGHRGFRIRIGASSNPDDAISTATVSLDRICPNPFSSSTRIEYKLNESSLVKLSIYNQRGQLVKQLVSDGMSAGNHTVSWDGRDAQSRKVASGIYVVRLNCGNNSSQKKLIYIAE